jgi:23S rRNA pseudouridine1911/1915/1917 synthase
VEVRVDPYVVLYEDEEILIVNKLAPIPVQKEKTEDPSLQDLLRAELAGREGGAAIPFLEAAHRIDRRASGAVLFAKTPKALSTVEAAFRDRRVDKTYIACVEREPVPPEGKLENRLVWDKRRNIVRALPLEPGAEFVPPAVGSVPRKKKAPAPEKAMLETSLLTGRHHQIRAQFAAAGFPIRGDLKYGARRSAPNGLIMLHARRLSLTQPRTGAAVAVLAPFPPSEPLWEAFTD